MGDVPYMVPMILRANELFSSIDGFEPDDLLALIAGQETVLDAADAAGLFAVLPDDQAAGLRDYLSYLPAGLDAALLAGLRSALERGLRTQMTWAPGYEFEVRAWEVSDGSDGLLNLHVVGPHPVEPSSI
jgi:hypothetical protein